VSEERIEATRLGNTVRVELLHELSGIRSHPFPGVTACLHGNQLISLELDLIKLRAEARDWLDERGYVEVVTEKTPNPVKVAREIMQQIAEREGRTLDEASLDAAEAYWWEPVTAEDFANLLLRSNAAERRRLGEAVERLRATEDYITGATAEQASGWNAALDAVLLILAESFRRSRE